MKLSAIYLVFNGLDLLEGSVNQISPFVDEILIGYQEFSHYGVHSADVKPFVERFCKKHKKARAVHFLPRHAENPKKSERRKINQLLREANGTHFFISATDHYYNQEEFEKCKEIAKGYQATASKMYTYFKKPEWRITPIEDYYMPFICRLSTITYSKDTKGEWPVYVDPALCIYPHDDFYAFKEEELMMHHYSFIRKDIGDKLNNAAAKRNFNNKIPEIIQRYEDFDGKGKCPYYEREIEIVDNFFGI